MKDSKRGTGGTAKRQARPATSFKRRSRIVSFGPVITLCTVLACSTSGSGGALSQQRALGCFSKGFTQIWLHLVFYRVEGTFLACAKAQRKSACTSCFTEWKGLCGSGKGFTQIRLHLVFTEGKALLAKLVGPSDIQSERQQQFHANPADAAFCVATSADTCRKKCHFPHIRGKLPVLRRQRCPSVNGSTRQHMHYRIGHGLATGAPPHPPTLFLSIGRLVGFVDGDRVGLGV